MLCIRAASVSGKLVVTEEKERSSDVGRPEIRTADEGSDETKDSKIDEHGGKNAKGTPDVEVFEAK
jgi:hypothetical protein